MICYLKGKIQPISEKEIMIFLNGGIGYSLYCYNYQDHTEEEQEFYISHIIKENLQELYGFSTLEQKNFFELLLRVKGVGPKVAFSILNILSINDIAHAIIHKNEKILKSVSGVGSKMADQIILDLHTRVIKSYKQYSLGSGPQLPQTQSKKKKSKDPVVSKNEPFNNSQMINDALLAIKELGYNEEDVIKQFQGIEDIHLLKKPEEIVQKVLKQINDVGSL